MEHRKRSRNQHKLVPDTLLSIVLAKKNHRHLFKQSNDRKLVKSLANEAMVSSVKNDRLPAPRENAGRVVKDYFRFY